MILRGRESQKERKREKIFKKVRNFSMGGCYVDVELRKNGQKKAREKNF